jgi:multiple sugar transport system substrate-binding protein
MRRNVFRVALMCMFSLLIVAPGVLSATKTLKVWQGYPECTSVFETAAEDYMKEHPGVNIEVSTFELRDLNKKVAIALPAGTGPDLYQTSDLGVRPYIESGLVKPAPVNVKEWIRENWDYVYYDPFVDNDDIYAVPWIQGFQVFYYNLDHYEEAGITAPPKNLDELMEHARKLARYDKAGNLIRSGISLRLSGGGMGVAQKFENFLFINGGSVLEPAGEGKWRANFCNEAGYKAMNFYLEAVHKYKVDSIMAKSDAEAFVLGLTSQFNRETWVIGEMKMRAPNVNYGIAQIPGGSAGQVTNLVCACISVPASTKNEELAWDFIRHLNSDKYLVQMMKESGWICTRSGVDYSEVYKLEPHFEQALDRPKDMKLIPGAPAVSSTEVYTKFADRLVEAFADPSMLDNEPKIMKFLQECSDEVNDILRSNGEYGE